MRKPLYGILAAVFLCTWKAEKTDADINTNLNLIQSFYLYNDCDVLYNSFNVQAKKVMLRRAEAYAKENSHPLVESDHIMKQYIHLSAIRSKNYTENLETMRSAVMLNFNLTIEAYSAAVNFRVCAFFHNYVDHDWLKFSVCSILSSYMEWYFSFMLEEKAEDLCTIERFFTENPNRPLKAEYVCNLLRKLNLNFLRFPGDKKFIDLLQDDENNIYKSDKLTLHDLETGQNSFISIFEKYRVPKKEENEHLQVYYKKVYYQIWDSVMDAYTEKFSELLKYFFEVNRKKPYPINSKPAVGKYVLKQTCDRAFELYRIIHLPTKVQRGAVYAGNTESTIGSVIYRSNAVEILRQISFYFVYPKLVNIGLRVSNIMTIINDGELKCPSFVAPENLSVDYCLGIHLSKELIPLLNH